MGRRHPSRDRVNIMDSMSLDNNGSLIDQPSEDSERRRSCPRGRPRKTIDLEQLQKLAELACTTSEAAAFLGVSRSTLSERFVRDPAAVEAWEKGKAQAKISLRRIQFRLAEKSAAMAIFLGKQLLGQRDDPQPAEPPFLDPVSLSRLTIAELRQLHDLITKLEQGADGSA